LIPEGWRDTGGVEGEGGDATLGQRWWWFAAAGVCMMALLAGSLWAAP
jgi:hypothetical protein